MGYAVSLYLFEFVLVRRGGVCGARWHPGLFLGRTVSGIGEGEKEIS